MPLCESKRTVCDEHHLQRPALRVLVREDHVQGDHKRRDRWPSARPFQPTAKHTISLHLPDLQIRNLLDYLRLGGLYSHV